MLVIFCNTLAWSVLNSKEEEILRMDSEARRNKCEYEKYVKNLNITTENVNESPKSAASETTEEIPNCSAPKDAHTTTSGGENEVEVDVDGKTSTDDGNISHHFCKNVGIYDFSCKRIGGNTK